MRIHGRLVLFGRVLLAMRPRGGSARRIELGLERWSEKGWREESGRGRCGLARRLLMMRRLLLLLMVMMGVGVMTGVGRMDGYSELVEL